MRCRPSLFLSIACLLLALPLHAQPQQSSPEAVEEQVREMVASPDVTIVHFWAPWCANCRAEMKPDGWARFIGEHPDVKFVFLNIWHREQDPLPRLREGALGGQPNLVLINHPNAARTAAERLARFLDLPITWVPTTWIFKDGKLRYALNYGEVRFEMLKTLVDDSRDEWKH